MLLKLCGTATVRHDLDLPEARAICPKQLQCFRYLLTLEPSLALARDDYGNTAAHCAAASGNMTALAAIHQLAPLLLFEANTVSGATPFITAALHLQLHALKYICTVCPDAAEAKGRYGRTAFAEVCNQSNTIDEDPATKRALGMLCKMNPTVGMTQDHNGNAPIHLAALHGHRRLVSALLLRFPGCADLRNNNGETALAIAASMKQVSIVKLFVSGLPHVAKIPDNVGKLPLQRAEGCQECHSALLMDTHKTM